MADGHQLLRMLEPAVRPAGAPAPRSVSHKPIESRGFDELLREAGASDEVELLRFSAHAAQRLEELGVELSEAQLDALNDATQRAAGKGANDSLLLMERLGMIVNVPNRTVVTVLGADRMTSGVVTQIDSTVWVDDPDAIADG
jgi:flagellar operon protein